ncbi:alpha/beta fold hydrolase [Nonomuraea gerenzanensis]|uniref:Beta-ketoadipate enol-lactone hydrolase n=1 Tax=Nonomuraea gerenzanensis TaxID=93944 RepID=A0A1M4EPY7_9ACTN|nr:alpha/beta hydrolase [Nonomuraea gerenzanensis]UBU12346.1 alpha/beta hydrolase [Nonomuraea gerenzanensis]SBP00890.1 Beta-ketoadipate enol-lactone hydrolase [Nonomuraea gerenzanensis]
MKVTTPRLTQHVLTVEGRTTGEPVLFVHGNVSSAAFWRDTMAALPEGYRPLAVDLRGFGDTDPAPVDATRGLRDYSDDLLELIDALEVERAHLVGWSMGGGVVLQALRERPRAVRSLTLVNPVSPYGYGGTEGPEGRLTHPDGTGAGAGAANPDFIARLRAGDLSEEAPTSPRNVFRSSYVKHPVPDEDFYVRAMLTTRVGEAHYPGDAATSGAWPGVAPGKTGVLNALAPTHFRVDDLDTIDPKPPILWIRGADDVIVSDTSLFDLAHLGALGVVPGSPGTPAQPMVSQTRAVLERYGRYRERVLDDCGHSPHLEHPEQFQHLLAEHLKEA